MDTSTVEQKRAAIASNAPDCACPARSAFAIALQDRLPASIRDSAEWRAALLLLAGTRGMPADLRPILIPWLWERLADQSVVAAVPESAREAWDAMLAAPGDAGRARAAASTAVASAVVAYAAYATASAYAYAAAYAAAVAAGQAGAAAESAAESAIATGEAAAYWTRANPAALLVRLCTEVTP